MNEIMLLAELWEFAQKNNRHATIHTYKPRIKELITYKIRNSFTISSDTRVLTGKPPEIMLHMLEDVCRVLETTPEKMMAKKRNIEISYMRHLFIKLCVDHKITTLTRIGHFMHRDHTTVMHSFRCGNNLIETKEPTFMAMWLRYLTNGDEIYTGIYDKSMMHINKREAVINI